MPGRAVETASEDKELLTDDGSKDIQDNTTFPERVLGYLSAVLSTLATVVGISFAQALGGIIPPFELNLFRFVAEFLLVVPIVWYKGISVIPDKKYILWITLLSSFSCILNICVYTAALFLAVGEMGAIDVAFVIIITGIVTLAGAGAGDCSKRLILPSALCLVGIIFLTQPNLIFKNRKSVSFNPVCGRSPKLEQECNDTYVEQFILSNTTENTPSDNDWHVFGTVGHAKGEFIGYGLILSGCILKSASFFISNKNLVGLPSVVVNFWISVVGIIVSALCMLCFETFSLPDSVECSFIMVGHGFGASASSILTQTASQLIAPVILSIVKTLKVVLSFLAQFTVMRNINPGRHNVEEIIGAVLVFVGNIILPLSELHNQYIKPK